MSAELVDRVQHAIVAQRSFTQSAPTGGDTAPAAVVAFDRAVTALLVLIQVVIGYVVEPILAGKAVDLSPLVTMVCLAFWGLCWGLTGMLIAVPLTAMLKIIWENMAYTRPLAVLMASGDQVPP